MNKQEAIQAMEEGKAVTHRLFTDEEWMKKLNRTTYEFEDGVLCPVSEFWAFRSIDEWEEGWDIVEVEDITDEVLSVDPDGNGVVEKIKDEDWAEEELFTKAQLLEAVAEAFEEGYYEAAGKDAWYRDYDSEGKLNADAFVIKPMMDHLKYVEEHFIPRLGKEEVEVVD